MENSAEMLLRSEIPQIKSCSPLNLFCLMLSRQSRFLSRFWERKVEGRASRVGFIQSHEGGCVRVSIVSIEAEIQLNLRGTSNKIIH